MTKIAFQNPVARKHYIAARKLFPSMTLAGIQPADPGCYNERPRRVSRGHIFWIRSVKSKKQGNICHGLRLNQSVTNISLLFLASNPSTLSRQKQTPPARGRRAGLFRSILHFKNKALLGGSAPERVLPVAHPLDSCGLSLQVLIWSWNK